MIKIFNIDPFNNNNNTTSIKSKIANELFNRYGFETRELIAKMHEPKVFETNKFPSIISLLSRIFNKHYVNSPLLYAKALAEDSKPKEVRLEEAMQRLNAYANYIKNNKSDDYDYTIAGIPVKWYDKFVQVGSYIIPLNNYSSYFNGIKDIKRKERIISTIITISQQIEEYDYAA